MFFHNYMYLVKRDISFFYRCNLPAFENIYPGVGRIYLSFVCIFK